MLQCRINPPVVPGFYGHVVGLFGDKCDAFPPV